MSESSDQEYLKRYEEVQRKFLKSMFRDGNHTLTEPGGIMSCCAASNPELYGWGTTFYGFHPWIASEPKTEFPWYLSRDRAEEYKVQRKEFSYTIPETGETLHYTVSIEGCTDGIPCENFDRREYSEEDEDEDF